jgi:hypothetical protein
MKRGGCLARIGCLLRVHTEVQAQNPIVKIDLNAIDCLIGLVVVLHWFSIYVDCRYFILDFYCRIDQNKRKIYTIENNFDKREKNMYIKRGEKQRKITKHRRM